MSAQMTSAGAGEFNPTGLATWPANPIPCGECKGKGRIELFVSTRTCAACGGTGKISVCPPDVGPIYDSSAQIGYNSAEDTTS